MRVVERHAHAVEADTFHGSDCMRDIALYAISQGGDAANTAAFGTRRVLIAEHEALDGDLSLVVELVAVAVDEFDAVVFKRVVRGGDDDTEVRAKLGAEHGDGRCGQLSGENDIDTGGIETRSERRLEHFARSTRVAAQHDLGTLPALRFAAEHDGSGLREAHDELRGHGMTIGHGTDAVGAEELALFRHRRAF